MLTSFEFYLVPIISIAETVLWHENYNLSEIVTPVHAETLETLLHHTQTKFLIDGFKNGFSIGYEGVENIQLESKNLRLTVGSEVELWNKVMSEVKAGRYAGPYKTIPYANFIQSPIGLVPKDQGKKTRLIFHLSHPRKPKDKRFKSVNAATPPEKCSVSYKDVDLAIRLCLLAGIGCKLGKSDMSHAFRNLGIKKEHWRYLVMKARCPLDNCFYYFIDKCLPFGAAISCSHFQRFSNAIAHLVKFRAELDHEPVNYLDDFLFIALLCSACNGQIQEFLDICTEIGFPVAMDKTFWASDRLIFLGLLIDTQRQLVMIPVEKITKAVSLINKFLRRKRKTVMIREIQQITGLLNFFGKCIVPGRAFTRRLYSLIDVKLEQHHHVKLTQETVRDLKMWLKFLQHPAVFARPFMDFTKEITANDVFFFTDASKSFRTGCGGVCKLEGQPGFWFYTPWDKVFLQEHQPSIAYLELYALVVGAVLWLHHFKNRRIYLFCDNISVVHMVNKTTSSCPQCMVLIRILVLHSMIHNVRVFAKYINTKANVLADHLSRLRINKFKSLTGGDFSHESADLPHDLWPMEQLWLKNKMAAV